MKRKRRIEWQGLENAVGDFHVVPIRKRRRDIGKRQVVQRRSLLGHSVGVPCWCQPAREIRCDGSLLYTHNDLPN